MTNDKTDKHNITSINRLSALRRVLIHGAVAGAMLGMLTGCGDVMDDYICQCKPGLAGDKPEHFFPPVPIKGPVPADACPHDNKCNNLNCEAIPCK